MSSTPRARRDGRKASWARTARRSTVWSGCARRIRFEPREVCCAKASLNFVDSIWELFGPLLKGVPTVLLPAALNYDLDAFTRTLARFRVTRLVLVPSLLRTMLETADGDLDLPDLKDLKHWVTSGEPLPTSLADEFLKRGAPRAAAEPLPARRRMPPM